MNRQQANLCRRTVVLAVPSLYCVVTLLYPSGHQVRGTTRRYGRRLRLENTLEILLGGALSALVYRIIVVVRDWKTEQRKRHAQASTLEAGALVGYQSAERKRLENELVAQLVTNVGRPPDYASNGGAVEWLLAQGVREQLHVLASARTDLAVEVVDA